MIPGMGMNPKQLKQMQRAMKQMGMEMKDLRGVKEVIIRLKDKDIIIGNPKVSIMDFMGQRTYQVTGKAKEKTREPEIPEEDIELVMSQTGATRKEAEDALKETNGDLAEAILRLS
ncbi:nascent polypeptide-associated complex protein [Methanothermobacter tenebrarum]|uniref:Nascent polypeptide-associated complex protein n=1 Tax=Methanothermobacter tenebrarum TaxID=680118 RepID=A0A328P8H5_9EURY|nr:nascent polypeptide-associated complex protein [Methanothermobacter tenebrarum]MBC7101546.1 nascent polypeptide-associated complex protein [Methanobacteriales archaeon]MBC7118279.1 nascent polypeptide-associated complex protein [Methanobacteriaceae archaeon]NPV64572.1 nascent polypeptide-associated complex protein [Methanobacteriaceae archaeon]RAO78697.1 nascent polypeptide-associated complex protein [Methanothermobacter tenebrarum]